MGTDRIITQKIIQAGEIWKLEQRLKYWRFHSHSLVFTNGCFDILHRGHLDYLARAADLGDILIIGLNTDDSVKRIKGPGRPLNGQADRAQLLASLFFVQAVVLFEQDTPLELIRLVHPDILVKGGDYQKHEVAGHELVEKGGGRVEIIDLSPGYSTSLMLDKLKGLS